MSDEPKKRDTNRQARQLAILLGITALLSYVGLFAYILLRRPTSPTLILIWVAIAAAFRLGMRLLNNRYVTTPPQ